MMLVKHSPVKMDNLKEKFTLPAFAKMLPILATAHKPPNGPSTLKRLHDELIEPFVNGVVLPEAADEITIKVVAAESVEATIAARMLTYGYCSHYYTGDGVPDLPTEPHNPHFQPYTLVATCAFDQTPLILGTLQAIVGVTVPALALFEPVPGKVLAHLAAFDGLANDILTSRTK